MPDVDEPKQEYPLDEVRHPTAAPTPAGGAQVTVCPRCNHDLSAFDSHDEEGSPTGPKRMHRLQTCFDFVKSDLAYAAPDFNAQKEQKQVRKVKEEQRQAEERKPREPPPEAAQWSDEEREEWDRREKARVAAINKPPEPEPKATAASESKAFGLDEDEDDKSEGGKAKKK